MINEKQTLTERFERYHRDNPQVYYFFKRFTFEVIITGKTKISHWLIINRIRWETEVEINTIEPFRISNDFIALYARLFMKEHPQYAGIFNTKEMKNA